MNALEQLRAAEVRGIALILAGVGTSDAARDFARSWLGDLEGHPDFVELRKTQKTVIQVKEVRETLQSFHLRPARAPVRILWIQADDLNDEGMNTLLKTLEEPPPYGIVILEAVRPMSIPPTVRSRCRTIRFAPRARQDVEAWLERERKVPTLRARLISALADGSRTRAEALATAWDELRPDRLPPGGDVAWTLALWGRAVSAALRVRAGTSPEAAAPWLAGGALDVLTALDEDRLVDLLDRITSAQTQIAQNVKPELALDAVGLP